MTPKHMAKLELTQSHDPFSPTLQICSAK